MAESEDDWIKARAYELWEAEGYPTGKDTEHWERATLEYESAKQTTGNLPKSRRKSAEPPAAEEPVKPATKPTAKPSKAAASKVVTAKTTSAAPKTPAPSPEVPGKKRAKKASTEA
ncbi:DUF2934 domain-containing protein [Neorhizobium lilium]|uniref:DUF2934 domain-containing protein n=1 Tax=Neorhizobium lilium TaxID=2503024 RepID=A0A444LJU9_9HYPH|nr:DUF2934 domain-containing protein [Neorhizobium lilium]RWX79269.1 DUF2934 domain-containing protein [Neorhizobium lilium]